ncbi:hypothetical protein AOQ84DRAFT_362473 [Glonium stellatum]|uniref:Rhodopsin domain-containing protein n=1 Tax=Glonium stellatum TaxID=574774 RepID=A0A8E2F4U9_9PEZI|nr:hypothetical protein AOQ84DRAFT_362473 [Glonium stellatum]
MDGFTENSRLQVISAIVCTALSGIFVSLRLLSKHLRAGYSADDAWICLATISFFTCIWSVYGDVSESSLSQVDFTRKNKQLTTYLKLVYVSLIFYYIAAAAVKISILCFCRRIFATDGFKRVHIITLTVVAMWFIGAEITSIVVCTPIQRFWNPWVHGHCLNLNLQALVIGILETILDAIILVLPPVWISTVQLQQRNKIALYGIFLLGGFAVITNIVRLKFIYQPHSEYVNFANAEIWTNIHVCTSIICACLPTLRPLLTAMATRSNTLQKVHAFLLKRDSSELHLRDNPTPLENSKVIPNSYGSRTLTGSTATWNTEKGIDGDV